MLRNLSFYHFEIKLMTGILRPKQTVFKLYLVQINSSYCSIRNFILHMVYAYMHSVSNSGLKWYPMIHPYKDKDDEIRHTLYPTQGFCSFYLFKGR
jgi:hypothetical protein